MPHISDVPFHCAHSAGKLTPRAVQSVALLPSQSPTHANIIAPEWCLVFQGKIFCEREPLSLHSADVECEREGAPVHLEIMQPVRHLPLSHISGCCYTHTRILRSEIARSTCLHAEKQLNALNPSA